MNAELNSLEKTQQRLNVGRSTLFKLVNSGELRSVKIGRRRFVTNAAIDDFIANLDARAATPKDAA